MDVFKHLGGGVSEKAILCVPNINLPVASMLGSGDRNFSKVLSNKLKKRQSELYNIANSGGKKHTSEYEDEIRSMSGISFIEADYNPNSISFSCQNERNKMHKSMNGDDSGTRALSVQNEIEMHVELIFDDMSVQDSFMEEKFELTAAGNILSSGKNVYRACDNDNTGLGRKNRTVRIPVDGIVALINNKLTRSVMFVWSSMVFSGELSGVQARYTMFNPQGNPVRAVVSLSINQGTKNWNDQERQYWDSAYRKFFGDTSQTGMFGIKTGSGNIQHDSSRNYSGGIENIQNLIQL